MTSCPYIIAFNQMLSVQVEFFGLFQFIIKAGKKKMNITSIDYLLLFHFLLLSIKLPFPTMVDAIVTDLLKQLGSTAAQHAQQEIKLIVGVDQEVQMLKDGLRIAQTMLNNAEERQVSDVAVKLWFDQLKDVYYMMDDVLDTWNTARIKSQIQKEEKKKKKLINLVL